MAGVGDAERSNVIGCESDLVGKTNAEALLAADRENGNLELAGSEEFLIVDGVLPEGGELRESIMHRVRPRIERCVVNSRLLIDVARIGRQLVVETIEVETLAASNQPFLVGSI